MAPNLNLHLALTTRRFQVLPSGLLTISDTRPSDQGDYRCKVRGGNTAGGQTTGSSRPARLTVAARLRDRAKAPSFAVTPRNVKAFGEGATVTLDCAANGNPRYTYSQEIIFRGRGRHPTLC